MAVVSRRNYIGRSIVACQRKGETELVRYVDRALGKRVIVDLATCREIDRYTRMHVLEANKARRDG
jgi:hypothetical protein